MAWLLQALALHASAMHKCRGPPGAAGTTGFMCSCSHMSDCHTTSWAGGTLAQTKARVKCTRAQTRPDIALGAVVHSSVKAA